MKEINKYFFENGNQDDIFLEHSSGEIFKYAAFTDPKDNYTTRVVEQDDIMLFVRKITKKSITAERWILFKKFSITIPYSELSFFLNQDKRTPYEWLRDFTNKLNKSTVSLLTYSFMTLLLSLAVAGLIIFLSVNL